MSKQEEAGLILKLYELRRDETMRKARDWFTMHFHPETIADFTAAMTGPQSGYLRMVVSYWDMAAGFVNSGAISMEMFNNSNGEHVVVFSKIEPLLKEIHAAIGPQFGSQLQKFFEAMPDGRKRLDATRERMKQIRAIVARQAQAAQRS